MPFDHWLNVYQRPVQGSRFLGRYKALRYRHSISAVGWYDTAQCDLLMSRAEAERFIEDMIGCRVAVFVDNPAEPAWDGYINRITINAGGVMYTRSLDEMMNRVRVIYSAPSVGAAPEITAVANLSESQARYGIKAGSIEGKVLIGMNVSKMTALRNTFLNVRGLPQNSTIFNQTGGDALISVEMNGWYQTLNWAQYQQTNTTLRTASGMVATILAAYPNTSFFSVSDTSEISTNSAWSQSERDESGRTFWQMLQSIQEAGDSANKWIMGITPTDWGGNRRLYYRQANGAIEYTYRARDGRVRDLFGKPVKPWLVRPDRGIRVTDVLTGWQSTDLDDPREYYVDRVEYDAEPQYAQPVGPDDITAEGVFQVRNFYEAYGKKFSFKGRVNWS